MRTLTGTAKLVRLLLRLERIRLTAWVLLLGIAPVGTASAFQGLYTTEAARAELAATVASNPSLTALLGPLYDSSIGGLTAWRIGTLGSFLVGLMAVLTVLRHTRDDEEAGRRELLGSTVVGRHAPLAAAFSVAAGAGAAIGLIIVVGLTGLGLPIEGSIAFGLGFAGVAVAFAAVGAIAAQLTQAGSTGRGLGVGLIGVFFLVRMAGDASGPEGPGWLAWLSPIGWFSRLRPFADERWWVLGLWVGFAAFVAAMAVAIQARRDVGEGAIPTRPGPSRGPRSLSSAFGLAWRLHRWSLLGWTAGLASLGVVYGGAGDAVGDMLASNPQLMEIFEQLGSAETLTDTFFVAAVGIIAQVTAAYSIRSVLRLKVEEDSLRSEMILATATTRARLASSHLFYGLVGPVLILAVAGGVAGATYGVIIGDVAQETYRVMGIAMTQVPAIWVLTGITIALYGLAPHLSALSWGSLALFLMLGQLGQILQFPQWSLNLSPFTHVAGLPGDDFAVPILVLLGITAALVVAGVAGFQNRDVPA